MSSVDDTVPDDKECGADKRKKLKTSEAKIEFCKKTALHYSLSSDCEFGREESDSEEGEGEDGIDDRMPRRQSESWKQDSKTIGEVLSYNHANLSSVVLHLMNNRNTEVMAQAAFLKGEYLKTGQHDHCEDLDLLTLNNMTYYAGNVEQAIVAGLQIVYFFAKSGRLNGKHTAKDAEVMFSHNKAKKFTRFDVFYKINGYDTKLAIAQEGQDSYISLYIQD